MGLVTLARTCMSPDTAPQEKMLHHHILSSFGTCHAFRTKLKPRAEVPQYNKIPEVKLLNQKVYAIVIALEAAKYPHPTEVTPGHTY